MAISVACPGRQSDGLGAEQRHRAAVAAVAFVRATALHRATLLSCDIHTHTCAQESLRSCV